MCRLLLVVIFCMCVSPSLLYAKTVRCDSLYKVESSDSLSSIAGRVYGSHAAWRDIYNVNRAIIGADPDSIEIGTELLMPCLAANSLQANKCNVNYKIQQGDSLSKIAGAAYGAVNDYQRIVNVNPGKIRDPGHLEIGWVLYIPCKGVGDPLPPLPLPPPSELVELRILTGNKYSPYVDTRLLGGGHSKYLVSRALIVNAGRNNFLVDMDEQGKWSEHLRERLAVGEYDLAFPWYKPGCEKKVALGDEGDWRCENLIFSEALHEVIVSYHALKGTEKKLGADRDMKGKIICRPKGYFTHDLEAKGLSAGSYVRVAPADPIDCYKLLVDGKVDIATVNSDTAQSVVTELDIEDQIFELPDSLTRQTLHVVGMKSNPDTAENLKRINEGLSALQASGELRDIAIWFQPGF